MALPNAAKVLEDLRDEIAIIARDQPSVSAREYTSWRSRTRSALEGLLGKDHQITTAFVSLKWTPRAYTTGDHSAFADRFRSAAEQARGYLDAAVDELDNLPVSNAFDSAGVDPELWAFVHTDIEGEHWGKTANQTTLFLEDRIRKWTGQPAELVGVDLMRAVLGPGADYRVGRTDGEKDGWHQFARGIVMALRNAAAHRIEDRPDHRRYVLGVVGSCSLLLTQLRFEHGNRFADLLPVPELDRDTVVIPDSKAHLK